MITSCGSTPYFLVSRTFNIVASNPFNEDILSANRQLIGMLGKFDPTNVILSPYFRASGGRLLEMRGFCRIPSRNNFSVCWGTKYVSGVNEFAPSRLPIAMYSAKKKGECENRG
jgi:hypothetical protein